MTGDWMIVEGRVHHIDCLRRHSRLASPCAQVDAAMAVLGEIVELDAEQRDAAAVLLHEVYLAGARSFGLVVYDKPEPNALDVGDLVEWPTFASSSSAQRRTGNVAAIDHPRKGWVTILGVELQDGREIETQAIVWHEHVRRLAKAVRR